MQVHTVQARSKSERLDQTCGTIYALTFKGFSQGFVGSRRQGARRVQTSNGRRRAADCALTWELKRSSSNMHTSLGSLSGSQLRLGTAAPRRTHCRLAARAVAAVEKEVPAQQLSKPAPHGRLYNFAAGPACLPVEVLEEAQHGLLNWKGSGTSVMEMSHRGKEFSSIIQQAEEDLRALLKIPDNYQVFSP